MNKIFLLLCILVLIPSCAPTSTPVPTSTPDGLISPSVEVVDKFYKTINEAQKEEDLWAAYMMLTTEAMCSPYIFAYCEPSSFQKKWWKSKVAYKLYDCGDNVVIAEETRYPRGDDSLDNSSASRLSRFKLTQTEEALLISDVSFTPSIAEGCVLAVDRSEMP